MASFNEAYLKELFRNFQGKRIAVLGDLMVDRYYWGKVHRVSPEAPVPVVEVDTESVRLGGAANVAHNIQALGGDPVLVGIIGNDHAGTTLLEILKERSLTPSGIAIDPSRPTTMKTRVIAHGQHVVRIDNESKAECPAALQQQMVDTVKEHIGSLHGIIIEDYNKGVVTKDVIRQVVAIANEHDVPVTVDPKFNNFLEYRNVTVFKPNRREAEEALGGRLRTIGDIVHAGKHLLEVLQARNVLLTRGEDGMSLFEANGEVTHFPTTATNVQDVSGAGDTVISTLTMALVGGAGIRDAAILANCAGGIVVGEVGIVPVQPGQLIAEALRVANNHRVH